MSGLVPRGDASDLAEVVARAARLLDDGDVLAARILAAKAYDDAKAAESLARRFEACEKLTAKARLLQGEALLIEARAMMAIADEWDEAKAAGLAGKSGTRTDLVSDGNEVPLTAGQLGLTRKEVHEARKLRDAEAQEPGIVQRAIAARLGQGLSPTRANLRAAIGTASATVAERGDNLYQTPPEAVASLLALEQFAPTIWEPACGKGAISTPLEAAGHDVRLSDLVDYGTCDRHGEVQGVEDFLATRRDKGARPDIVTNPPYGGVLNAFVAHALREHRPRKMALLLNLNFMCGFDDADRNYALDECRPARVHVFTRRLPMMHREGWAGNVAASRMNTAWFVWEKNGAGRYSGEFRVNRVDWRDHGSGR